MIYIAPIAPPALLNTHSSVREFNAIRFPSRPAAGNDEDADACGYSVVRFVTMKSMTFAVSSWCAATADFATAFIKTGSKT